MEEDKYKLLKQQDITFKDSASNWVIGGWQKQTERQIEREILLNCLEKNIQLQFFNISFCQTLDLHLHSKLAGDFPKYDDFKQ